MRKALSQIPSEAIAAFRLRRNHLLDENEPPRVRDKARAEDAVTICRDICGVQAQVMSAAYLQLWTRNHALTRAVIEDALWKTRTLVKTSLMRQPCISFPPMNFHSTSRLSDQAAWRRRCA